MPGSSSRCVRMPAPPSSTRIGTPSSTTSTRPTGASASTNRPSLHAPIVAVTSARNTTPSARPVSALRPDGMSTAILRAVDAFIAATAAAGTPSMAPRNPVPKIASTTTAALANQFRQGVSPAQPLPSAIATPPIRWSAVRFSAASPRAAPGGAVSTTWTGTPARARCRAATNPSPPLLPAPQTMATSPSRRAPSPASTSRRMMPARPRPAFSIRMRLGTPSAVVAAASAARIWAAVNSAGKSRTPRPRRDRVPQLDDGFPHPDHHGARHQAVADVELFQPDQRRDRPDVAVVQTVTRAQAQSRIGRRPRRQLEALELPRDLRAARLRQAVVARGHLDGADAHACGRVHHPRLGIDEQADADSDLGQPAHHLLERSARRDRQAAFRRPLLALLGHQRAELRLHLAGDAQHLLGRRHLQVQDAAHRFAQHAHVAVLDVAPILAQVNGDAVGARQLAQRRGRDRIRVARAALLAQGRDVVDVDVQADHGANRPAPASTCRRSGWRTL